MKKTTLYLPERLKAQIERLAADEGRSEADVIRRALQQAVARRARPKPKIPLGDWEFGVPDAAERVDELMDGFGED